MGKVTSKIAEFPGFAVTYDPKEKPFFVPTLVQDLRQIASHPLGYKLLKEIADARPRIRKPGKNASADTRDLHFSKGINVMCVPTSVSYTQSGYATRLEAGGAMSLNPSDKAHHNMTDCPFHIEGGSFAAALDVPASENGTGCVSVMHYTNAQIITRKGETTYPFIVLAHELIHSLHHVTGTRHKSDEEKLTTGLPPYDTVTFSENSFRRAFGIKQREAY